MKMKSVRYMTASPIIGRGNFCHCKVYISKIPEHEIIHKSRKAAGSRTHITDKEQSQKEHRAQNRYFPENSNYQSIICLHIIH